MRTLLVGCLGLLALGSGPARADGPSADEVRKLVAQLKDRDVGQRSAAARELTKLGPEAKEAVPVLVGALGDADGEVRQVATNVLSKIGKPAVPALGKALESSDRVVRRQAALALSKVGADAKVMVKVARQFDYQGEFKVQVVQGPNDKGVTAPDITIPAGKDEAELVLTVAADAAVGNRPNLLVRATAMFNGAEVKHEAKFTLNVTK